MLVRCLAQGQVESSFEKHGLAGEGELLTRCQEIQVLAQVPSLRHQGLNHYSYNSLVFKGFSGCLTL
jgi:hypothetical protein